MNARGSESPSKGGSDSRKHQIREYAGASRHRNKSDAFVFWGNPESSNLIWL
jgi:hypothetical protein